MKTAYIISMLFLPLLAVAQRETVLDTSFVTANAGRFFETRILQYENGESSTTVTLIGDSAAVQNLYAGRISTEAAQVNAAAQVIIRRAKTINELNRLDAYATTLLGAARSPLLAVQTAQEWPFFKDNAGVAGWTLTDGSGTRSVTFDKNAQGQLRYRINGGTRERIILYGEVIRLRNFPATSQETDLYRLPNGNYTNLDRTISLRNTGR